MNTRRRARGLTLIEIVVALAILAVLSAIALPNYGARIDRERVQGAAEALAADVNEARFEAARQGRALHVRTFGGPAWCWAVTLTPECPCGSGQACQLRSARDCDHAGVLLHTSGHIEMGPDGRAASPATATATGTGTGTGFELESTRGLRLRVSVGAMGRAHVCTVQGEALRYPRC